jgi:hypothetical protein
MSGFAKRRKIAGNSRLKGASWSKFAEFADEFAAIRATEFAEKCTKGLPRSLVTRGYFTIVRLFENPVLPHGFPIPEFSFTARPGVHPTS